MHIIAEQSVDGLWTATLRDVVAGDYNMFGGYTPRARTTEPGGTYGSLHELVKALATIQHAEDDEKRYFPTNVLGELYAGMARRVAVARIVHTQHKLIVLSAPELTHASQELHSIVPRTVTVRCRGKHHKIELTREADLVLHGHPDLTYAHAEEALSGETCKCLDILFTLRCRLELPVEEFSAYHSLRAWPKAKVKQLIFTSSGKTPFDSVTPLMIHRYRYQGGFTGLPKAWF